MDVFRPPRHSSVSRGRLPTAFEPNHEHRYSPSDREEGEGKEGRKEEREEGRKGRRERGGKREGLCCKRCGVVWLE